MEFNRFDETLLRAIQDAAMMAVLFNEKAAPIIGVEIQPDGSAVRR